MTIANRRICRLTGSFCAFRKATRRRSTWRWTFCRPRRGDARFVDDAGHLAAITLQKPVRVAVHAKSLFTRDDGGSGNG